MASIALQHAGSDNTEHKRAGGLSGAFSPHPQPRSSSSHQAFVVETMYGVLSRNIQSTAQTYRLDPDAAVEVGINMRV